MWADTAALKQKRAYDIQFIRTAGVLSAGAHSNDVTTHPEMRLPRPNTAIIFVMNVTAAATEVGDTLDVAIQTNLGGTSGNWIDVVAFTQVLGNGGAKCFVAKITNDGTQAMFETGTALTAGNTRNLIGDSWRLKINQVDANSNAAFNFSVAAMVI